MLVLQKEHKNKIDNVLDSFEKKKQYFIRQYIFNKNNKKILYIHTPYCTRKCSYCVCQSLPNGTSDQIETFYKRTIYTQLNEYKDIFEHINFDQIYFGGGTPTLVNPIVLQDLFNKIPNFKQIDIKCIECSPETLHYDHLNLFKENNFDFISVGIQSLDKSICKKQNRYYISPKELSLFSQTLKNTGIYFNYDLIAFMGNGDIRDLPKFENELAFIMQECKPSSITIHQLFQSLFTFERTEQLINMLNRLLYKNNHYTCINSNLLPNDIYNDSIYQAEYRLVCGDKNFSHYMWNKYSSMPIKGYDILSIGYTDLFHTISNVNGLLFSPGENKLKKIKYNNFIYDDFNEIRKNKGLPI